jgi:hypothetical protein
MAGLLGFVRGEPALVMPVEVGPAVIVSDRGVVEKVGENSISEHVVVAYSLPPAPSHYVLLSRVPMTVSVMAAPGALAGRVVARKQLTLLALQHSTQRKLSTLVRPVS